MNRRQVPEPCAGGLDHPTDYRGPVAAEIIDYDDVAGLQGRHKLLLDMGAEAFAVDWPLEDAKGPHSVAAQRPAPAHWRTP